MQGQVEKHAPSVNEQKFKTYLFEYFHDDAWWSIEIAATSREEAEARLQKMPLAKFSGTLIAKIPASLGWLARFRCWLGGNQ